MNDLVDNDSPKTIANLIKSNWIFLSAFAIFASLFKLYIFYKCFHIRIFYFIDLNESIIMVFDNIISFVCATSILLTLIYGITKTPRWLRMTILIFLLAFLVIVGILMALGIIPFTVNPIYFITLLVGVSIFGYFAGRVSAYPQSLTRFSTLIGIMVSLLSILTGTAFKEADDIKKGHFQNVVTRYTENAGKVDDNFTFIGRTKSYSFYWDSQEDYTLVLNNSDIQSVKFKDSN